MESYWDLGIIYFSIKHRSLIHILNLNTDLKIKREKSMLIFICVCMWLWHVQEQGQKRILLWRSFRMQIQLKYLLHSLCCLMYNRTMGSLDINICILCFCPQFVVIIVPLSLQCLEEFWVYGLYCEKVPLFFLLVQRSESFYGSFLIHREDILMWLHVIADCNQWTPC